MHFVFLTLGYHPDIPGGAYRYVAEVAERLAQRGHAVDVVYPKGEPAVSPQETRAGVHLHRYPNAEGFFVSNWRRENTSARRILRDITRSDGQKTLPVVCHAYLASTLHDCPARTAFLFTGPWAEEFRFSRRARHRAVHQQWFDELIAAGLRRSERWALRRVDRILTISQFYQGQLPRWHGTRLAPITMISGGVNLEQFRPVADRAAVRADYRLKPDQFLFLTLRRLDPRMGLLALIDGFAHVARENSSVQLWIAGDGPQREQLQRRIQQRELGGRLRLLGFVPEAELPRLLNAADCTVMPSLDLEGFGLVTVESLACGTPVIGSQAGATPELLRPLSPDLLFEAGSPDALAEKMKSVLANQAFLPDRTHCREYVVKNFSWERPVSAFEQCHRDLIQAGGGA